MTTDWITVEADAALYVDHGRATILCDRLPRPVTLVLRNPRPPVDTHESSRSIFEIGEGGHGGGDRAKEGQRLG